MMLRNTGTMLQIDWPDGFTHAFHPIWLREFSFEPGAKDPATGHRLYEAAFLPLDLAIRCAEFTGQSGVALEFSDGHRCGFELGDLRAAAARPLPDDLVGAPILWDASSWQAAWHDCAAIAAGPAGLLAFFDDLAQLGIALVRGLPVEADGLRALTDLIGPIRETNWGGIADVRPIANGYDLSMTERALEPHVDNPYRLPQPGYIFLHCLVNAASGGESVLIDGFNVAAQLQQEYPKHFAALCTTPVTFAYRDDSTILEHYGHLIERRPDGKVWRVIFHNRADQVVAADPKELSAYYAARRTYADFIWSPHMQATFKLAPGEAYVVDNFRILHGRRAFDGGGERHLRQCYMDRDILSGKQKVLLREAARQARPAALRSAG
jgi:gamma-butyrobetaine dioxygenase